MVKPDKSKKNFQQRYGKRKISSFERVSKHRYGKQLYFHVLNNPDAKHNLRYTLNKAVKNSVRGEFSEIGFVHSAVRVDISYRMLYDAKDLHMIPHGQATVASLPMAKANYAKENVVFAHIDLHRKQDWNQPHLKLCYPGSKYVQSITEKASDFDETEFLKFALGKDGEMIPELRDNPQEGGVAKRFSIGFVQNQGPTHSKKSEVLRFQKGPTFSLPFFQKSKADLLPAKLKKGIGQVLNEMMVFLDDAYGDGPNNLKPFNDTFRNKIFSKRLASEFGEDCKFRAEFIEFFIESNSDLGRHLDYMNARAPGYNHLSSFSFTAMHEGKEYRVSLIIAGRKLCDGVMQKIEAAGLTDDGTWEIVKDKK